MLSLVSSLSLVALFPAAPCADEPTFHRDVAPIVFEHCVECHRPGQSAPFSLLSYDDVESRAEQIVDVTHDRYMPPWLPTGPRGDFADDRRLTDEQLAVLTAWVDAGVPAGDPADSPPVPTFTEGWQMGAPDLIVTMEDGYVVPAEGRDLFRTFVLPVPMEEARYVRAVELDPDNRRVIHHAVIMIDDTGASRQLDKDDEGPGFEGMEAGAAHAPDGHFLGWTPGKVPTLPDDDFAWTLRPDTDLVLQLHLVPTGKPEALHCRIGLFFTDTPPARTPFLLRLGSQTIDIPAGEPAYEIEDEFTLPVDVEAIAVYPHAHYLGKRMEIEATIPGQEPRSLLRIDDWDFNWQDDYRYASPVTLPAGTRLHGSISFDNSADNVRNPHYPPRRVEYGPQSEKEMADLWIQVVPLREEDRPALFGAYQRKDVQLRLSGYRFLLAENPDQPHEHYNMGLCLAQLGDVVGAKAAFEKAVELDPTLVSALENLGILLAETGQLEESRARFLQALEADPHHANTHANLGALSLRAEKYGEAREHLLKALENSPRHLKAHLNLITVYRHFGDPAGALPHLRQAARLQASALGPQLDWVDALLAAGRPGEALDHLATLDPGQAESPAVPLRRALALDGVGRREEAAALYEAHLAQEASPRIALRLAWIQCTAPEDALRDGKSALFWARGSLERLGEDPEVLDVMAAAFAETGKFKKAVSNARKALRLTREAGDEAWTAEIEQRIATYEAERPWRDGDS